MNVNYDQLQDSLECIKSVCESAQECGGCCCCPLGDGDGGCKLMSKRPCKLHPKHPETDVFRAL